MLKTTHKPWFTPHCMQGHHLVQQLGGRFVLTTSMIGLACCHMFTSWRCQSNLLSTKMQSSNHYMFGGCDRHKDPLSAGPKPNARPSAREDKQVHNEGLCQMPGPVEASTPHNELRVDPCSSQDGQAAPPQPPLGEEPASGCFACTKPLWPLRSADGTSGRKVSE